jgi:type VI secretion system secreted protein VgrG
MAEKRHAASVRLEADKVDLTKIKTQIREIHGRERISQLFNFDIHLASPEPLNPEDLLQSAAQIVFERRMEGGANAVPVEERRIAGVVCSVRDRLVGEGWASEYVLRVVPKLWFTSLSSTSDVFLEKSVPDIVKSILVDHYGWKEGEDFAFDLDATYVKRSMVVQYQETHLSFIQRLLEHLGICYVFEDSGKVVFTDKKEAFKAANPDKAIFSGAGEESHVFELEAAFRHIPAGYRTRDYDYKVPQLELASAAFVDKGKLGLVDEYGIHMGDDHEGDFAAIAKDTKRLADVRAQMTAAEYQAFEGRGEYPGFRAGSVTTIEEHHAESVTAGKMLITEVIHRAVQPAHGYGEGGEQTYQNEFRMIPLVPYRPPKLTRKPVVSGLLTAMVETKGEETLGAIDDTGCYRLNFHYDGRVNTKDGTRPPGTASRPVRMAQLNTGVQRKFHFPLRNGTEVVVSCVNGDPDKPVILGAVPDLGGDKGKRGSPIIDQNKMKVLLTTNESELSIDDEKGNERWRTRVADWSHVLNIGKNEADKWTKTHIREDGFALASIDHITTTVNKQMTFESDLQTSLQQVRTLLTNTKQVDFTGEDPGWEDWKNVEEALAKAEEYARSAVAAAAEARKKAAEAAKQKVEKAKGEHGNAKAEALAELNRDRAKDDQLGEDADLDAEKKKSDDAHGQASAKAKEECAAEEQKEAELREAEAKYEAASEKQLQASQRVTAATQQMRQQERLRDDAERRAKRETNASLRNVAKQEAAEHEQKRATAEADREAAEAEADEALTMKRARRNEVEKKKKELAQAKKKCREARDKKRKEQAKQDALAREKKARDKRDKAQSRADEAEESWKRVDAKVKKSEAVTVEKGDKEELKAPEKKDLWSKIAKKLSDEAHKTHLKETQDELKDCKSSLSASTEREAAKAGDFDEPYSIRIAKHSTGMCAHNTAFMYGDKHAAIYSHEQAMLVSGDKAHVKAETGVEVATDDWIKLTSSKMIDINCDKHIMLVADSADDKSMPGGHSMFMYSFEGIKMESATGKIEGKAMKSIELTADTMGIKMTASLANIDMKATAGQIKGMATAGFMFNTPATITTSAAGAQTHSAAGAYTASAAGAMTLGAGGAITVGAGAALTCGAGAAATFVAGGVCTIGGLGLVLF